MTTTPPTTEASAVPPPDIDAAIEDLALQLKRSAPRPLHDQISGLLRQRIVSGRWPSHMRLPSEPELARMLGVSRGTVKRSTHSLTEEGLLVQHQGRGTFVASRLLEDSFAQEIISTSAALDRAGVRYSTKVLRQSLGTAAEPIAAQLHVAESDAAVVSVRRVRAVEGVPVFVLDNYIVASFSPDLERADLTSRTLMKVLEDDFGLTAAGVQRTFEAQAATTEIASLLEVPVGSPVLYLEQISYDDESTPFEYSDVWIRGDKFRISSWLRR